MGACCPAPDWSDEPVDSVAVTSSVDTVSVVTTGVAFHEKCDVPSGLVCDYDDYFYDGHCAFCGE